MKNKKVEKEIEQNIVKDYINEKISCVKLGIRYNLSSGTIYNVLKRNNIKVINYQNLILFDIKDVIKDYVENQISLTNLAKKYNTTRNLLSKKLKENNIDVINRQNLLRFNENIFDNIDTEEKAYWLGFIYADGYIGSRPLEDSKKSVYNFELSLSLHDKEHLQKFADFMEHPTNIKYDSYRCRFFITNKHLWNTLNNYGCTPRKSLTLEFPNENIFKSKDLIRHFIRGYFDGDGCVSYTKIKNNYSIITNCLGTENILNNILNYSKIKANLSLNNRKNILTKYFNLGKTKSFILCDYIYENCSIYLTRKYKRYLFFKEKNCRSFKELNELLQTNIGEN